MNTLLSDCDDKLTNFELKNALIENLNSATKK